MAKKYTFNATLFTRDLKVTLTCDELQYHEELNFTEEDEWQTIHPRGNLVFDVYLLTEGDGDWGLIVYRNFPNAPDTKEKAIQIVHLTIHDDSNEDEEEAQCIARTYEWICIYCGYMNLLYEWTEESHCCSCGRNNKIQEPEHAYRD